MERFVKKKIIQLIIILVAAAIIAVGVFFIKKKIAEKKSESTGSGWIEEQESLTGEIISECLADIGELATEEYFYTEVETFDSSKSIKGFEIPFTTSTVIFSYEGVIKAGIDFTAITVEKDNSKKVITVTIPKSKILSSEIDNDSFEVYDEKNSIFNRITVTDVNDSIADLKERAESKAIDKGILDKADANAKLLIKNLLKSTYDLSGYVVKVVTEE